MGATARHARFGDATPMTATRQAAPGTLAALVLASLFACGGFLGSSSADPGVPGPAPLIAVSVSPSTASTTAGGSVTFRADVTGTTPGQSTAVTWSVREAGGGSIGRATGVYSAPAAPGTFTVVATSVADGSRTGTATVTVAARAATVRDQLAAMAKKRWFFAHMSVGSEICGDYDPTGGRFTAPFGLAKLLADNAGSGLSVVRTTSAVEIPTGTFGNAQLNDAPLTGVNGDPASKMAAFQAAMAGGLGNSVDLAFVKLGFVDQAMLFADRSTRPAPGLSFKQYQDVMTALQAAYPRTRFLHTTVSHSEAGAAYNNDQADNWNQMLRATYPASEIFDVAWWDSHGAGGDLATATANDGLAHPALHPDWAQADGGHLNQAGADMLARKLVEFLGTLQ